MWKHPCCLRASAIKLSSRNKHINGHVLFIKR
uniref:Uncharacterized protein n=1 Tax=Anguilla anguilla TaxID=7936 RepID=A0A0E9PVT0_ANGAN